MSVYGRERTRLKRTRPMSDSPIFSSDEDDVTDRSSLDQSTDRLAAIVQDKVPVARGNWELLPSAEIKRSSGLRRSKERKLAVDDGMQNDILTTSPKRYTRLIETIRSPLKSGDFITGEKRTPKKSVGEKLRALAAPESSPSRSVQSPSTTPAEKDAWNSLFDGIEETGVTVPPISKLELPDSKEDEICEEEDFQVDIQSMMEDLKKEVKSDKESTRSRKETKVTRNSKRKTYGHERSYLIDERAAADEKHSYKDIHKEQISNLHDYNQSYEDEENEDKHNIYDLRISGKVNQRVELMSYMMEGLVFQESENLLSDNSLLITTLLDINERLSQKSEDLVTDMYHTFVEEMSKILQKLSLMNSSEKDLLIKLLSIVIYEFIIASEDDEYRLKAVFQAVSSFETVLYGLAFDFDKESQTSLIQKYLRDIEKYNHLGEQMQVRLIRTLKNSHCFEFVDCFVPISKLLGKKVTVELKTTIIDFFEAYFEEGDAIPTLKYLTPEFDSAVEKVSNSDYDDVDAGILKLLVLLSTNYSYDNDNNISTIYEIKYIESLLKQINSNYNLICQGKYFERDMNVSLFALGFLINFIEFHNFSLNEDHIHQNKKSLGKVLHSKSDVVKHLIGYNMIFLAYLHTNNSLDLQVSFLLDGLTEFSHQVENQGIRNKINELTSRLENRDKS